MSSVSATSFKSMLPAMDFPPATMSVTAPGNLAARNKRAVNIYKLGREFDVCREIAHRSSGQVGPVRIPTVSGALILSCIDKCGDCV